MQNKSSCCKRYFFLISLLFMLFTSFTSCAGEEFHEEEKEIPIIGESNISLKDSQALKSKYQNKKVSIMGNSRCTYAGYIPLGNRAYYPKGDVNTVRKTWWWIVLDYLGASLEINNSYSAGRITNTHPSYPNYLDRVDNLGSPDIIFLWGGVNDQNNGIDVGAVDTLIPYEEFEQDKFAPSLIKLIKRMHSLYDKAKIILFIENDLRGDYKASMQKIATYFELETIDISDFPTCKSDALHYNSMGMTQVANEVIRQLVGNGEK